MPKPPMRAGSKLLLTGFVTSLIGWMPFAHSAPLVPALAVSAGIQDEGDEEYEEEDENDGEEEEEEEEEEEAEEDADEQDDGADEQDEGADGDAAADDEDQDDPAQDATTNLDQGEADAEADDADEYVAAEDDEQDDSWASGWLVDDGNEADDSIPVDYQRYGRDQVWAVAEPRSDYSRGAPEGDSVGGGGEMLSVRSAKLAPRGTSGKPKPRKIVRNSADDEDTVYSFGGVPVAALSVPWQAQIFYPAAPAQANDKRPAWQRQHYCGGALIAPDWVLTAAHCIDQNMVDLGFKVRLGAQDISKGDGVTYKIDRIVRHSQYNANSNDVNNPPNMYANDIALIRIVPDGNTAPVDPRRIRQIPVNAKPLAGGVPVSATGWGVTGTDNANVINSVMLRVDLQAMPNAVCQQRDGYGPQKIKDTVFCAANPVQSTCRGDSGGPVVLRDGSPVLVGIVSWGKRKCAGDGRPGVYTRIDRYTQWIDQAMKLPPGKNSLP